MAEIRSYSVLWRLGHKYGALEHKESDLDLISALITVPMWRKPEMTDSELAGSASANRGSDPWRIPSLGSLADWPSQPPRNRLYEGLAAWSLA